MYIVVKLFALNVPGHGRCPSSRSSHSDEDIHQYITRHGEADPDFRICLGPYYEHGQSYERALQHPRFKCKRCAFEICFRHKTPWHEGRSGKQYDDLPANQRPPADWAKVQHRVEQEEKETDAKVEKCPKCGVAIYKTGGGCDYMRCTRMLPRGIYIPRPMILTVHPGEKCQRVFSWETPTKLPDHQFHVRSRA